MIDKIQKLLTNSNPIIQATNAKEASVLLTLVTVKDTLSLLYTLRSPALQRNSGQVSFPGGMKDPQDKDYEATAQRETREEIGISNIIILGRLAPVLDRTLTIRVHPIVGYVHGSIIPKDLKCNPAEVSSVFSVGLEDLISKRNCAIQTFNSPFKMSIPSWDIKADEFGIGAVSMQDSNFKIWGLTAYITDQFLRLFPITLKL
jgi:nudix motif 8